MPSNIEIKAVLRNRAGAESIAARLSGSGPQIIQQDDSFFRCAGARLKLRILGPGEGELIRYERPDVAGARCSRYLIARTPDPFTLLDILTQTLGALGRVRKRRSLYLIGQTRVHLDQVEGLGEYLELEVVLRPGQSETEGEQIAAGLLAEFGIGAEQLIAGAYVDLLPPCAAEASRPITYREWLQMPATSDRIEEVVNGEVRSMPPNKSPHMYAVENLAHLLKQCFDRKQILVVSTSFGLVIRTEPLTTRVPDLAVFLKQNIVEIDGYIQSAPELAVEVLSPGNTRGAREEKLRDYESLAVPEVWIVSPEAQTLEVLKLDAARLRTTSIVHSGSLAPRLFPQAIIEVAAIWEP